MASTIYPPLPQPYAQMSFSRPASDVASFDSRPPSFSSMQPQQHMPYTTMAAQAHQNNMGHNSNSFRSFGEVNGHQVQQTDQSPQIYTVTMAPAVYSSVAVYEMEIHGVAVMRRRCDSWLNATQILKVAGVEKGKRTKILEKEILTGHHEKIQGGYGKYQGTWVNYQRGREFCRQYGVEEILLPLLEHDMVSDGTNAPGHVDTPTKEQAMAAQRKRYYNSGIDNRINGQTAGGTFFQNISSTASHALTAMSKAARFESPMPRPGSAQRRPPGLMRRPSQQQGPSQNSALAGSCQQSFTSEHGADLNGIPNYPYRTGASQTNGRVEPRINESLEPPRKKMRPSSSQDLYGSLDPALQDDTPTEPNESMVYNQTLRQGENGPLSLPPLLAPSDQAGEEKRLALLDLFADSSRTDFTSHTAILHLSGQDLDIPLDASANTALHWAATLARVLLMRLLISKGANIFRGNAAGQTPLMAAVQVNNSLDHGCFPDMLEILGPLIEIRDATGRTVLHHIAVSSGIKGRSQSSKYYLESLLAFTVRKGSNPNSQQDSFDNGLNSAGQPKFKLMNLRRFMSEVVNVQDKSGNTALNLVARIGNRVIINQLDEVGADYYIANHTGFRPTDFGVYPRGESKDQQSSSENQSSSQTKAPSQIDQIKEEIFATTTSILSQTQTQSSSELAKKQQLVDQQNAEIREIAKHHKHELERFETLQRRAKDRLDRQQKIANLRRHIAKDQQQQQQQQRTLQSRTTATASTPQATKNTMQALENVIDPALLGEAATTTTTPPTEAQKSYLASLPSCAVLRAQLAAYTSNNENLQSRVAALKGRSSELEGAYRKVVSLCTGLEEGRVDAMLEGLTAAVESEGGEAVEVGRVREFLRKVEGVET